METEDLSVHSRDGTVFFFPQYRMPLTPMGEDGIMLHSDAFTITTSFAVNSVMPFVHSLFKKPSRRATPSARSASRDYVLRTSNAKRQFTLRLESNTIWDLFGHAEFIATFAEPKQPRVPYTALVTHMIRVARRAVVSVDSVLQSFSERDKIHSCVEGGSFPYPYVWTSLRFPTTAFFSRFRTPLESNQKARFRFQCTIGTPWKQAEKIMRELRQAFLDVGGSTEYDSIPEVDRILDEIYLKGLSQASRVFLFLFLYSFVTLNDRVVDNKSAMFIIRHSFFQAVHVLLSDKECREILNRLADLPHETHSRLIAYTELVLVRNAKHPDNREHHQSQNMNYTFRGDLKDGHMLIEYRVFSFVVSRLLHPQKKKKDGMVFFQDLLDLPADKN